MGSTVVGKAITPKLKSLCSRLVRGCIWLCVEIAVPFSALVVVFALYGQVPESYLPIKASIEPPLPSEYAAMELDGFDSPYLGHTGSWDGKGGAMWGASKVPDLDKEVEMGLRWTFMQVYWSTMEPDGPVDLGKTIPPAWQALDTFVIEAQKRKLNILMQAPVVGGNAGGPPIWAGRREPGKSAPKNMEAAAAFAGKLAARYSPGGVLSTKQGWGRRFGIRAWELDNEPDSYRTHWQDQEGDYAEFVTKAASQIKRADPRAMILAPATAGGFAMAWIEATLDARLLKGSPDYRRAAIRNSIGPVTDGVSFHLYEGLAVVFHDPDCTVERLLGKIRGVFNRWESRVPGFHYAEKREYWHTEGNYDFIGWLSAERRAAWRIQFFTRAFAAGVRKVCVMDASERERAAVCGYVKALPRPFPMRPADDEVKVTNGRATAFVHLDGDKPEAGQVWVLWAVADTGDARVTVPVIRERVDMVSVDGVRTVCRTFNRHFTVNLKGDGKMAPPVLVVDQPTRGKVELQSDGLVPRISSGDGMR